MICRVHDTPRRCFRSRFFRLPGASIACFLGLHLKESVQRDHHMNRHLVALFAVLLAWLPAEVDAANSVELWGRVIRVAENGVFVESVFEEGNPKKAWRGVVFLTAHPNQPTLAVNDRLVGIICENVGTVQEAEAVFRVYKFLSVVTRRSASAASVISSPRS